MAAINVASIVANFHGGDHQMSVASINLGTYATGGSSFTPALLGLDQRIDFLNPGAAAGYEFQVDYTNSKILAYRQKDPANAGGADIPLTEVANGVDLSAVVVRAFAIGQ